MYEYHATITKVVDGDTFHLDVDLGLDTHVHTTVRIYGINAPEMSTDEGKAAKEFALTLVSEGSTVTINTIKDRKEKYGRYLAKITLWDGRDFGDVMVANGHAVPYFP